MTRGADAAAPGSLAGEGAWERYARSLVVAGGVTLDPSRVGFDDALLARMAEPLARAFDEMDALERGAVANPDEDRMVGHYWLRAPELAPEPAITEAIRSTHARIREFAAAARGRFTDWLLIGIGGSALGPQLVADALGNPADPMHGWFFDNTDPDGMRRTLARIGSRLRSTLVLTVSKSGGTKETRNGMLVAAAAFAEAGLDFARNAVAVTGAGSELDRHALAGNWLARFPMWDWVGGRTSVLSAVGLLPAELSGFDTAALLRGAARMDAATRVRDPRENPAATMAVLWHHLGGGRGSRDLVVLPYRDRLILFSRYLQQLVMESLGKELDRGGRRVRQGIAVYGNKGSTDQHAYVQQLRDGLDNFFVTFVEVLDEGGDDFMVEPGISCSDYLQAFLLGTRQALAEKGRPSITITLDRLDAEGLGALVALFERTVGLYASLIDVNAYHQPGVEAGKQSAARVLEVQQEALAWLRSSKGQGFTAAEIAAGAGFPGEAETVFHVLSRIARNDAGIGVEPGAAPDRARFRSG